MVCPVLFVHGYSSEGSADSAQQIYGTLPDDLRGLLSASTVIELDLSRWVSLSDGITLDDVSYAFERALRDAHPHLLANGFSAVVHSTGSLVVRNWLRLFSEKPSPLKNLVHLGGAHFGSGLAHIGRGQLARWGRFISGNDAGVRLLKELELGAWKTIDLHLYFLQAGNDMRRNYGVWEYCLVGSQTLRALTFLPIRYVKEDSSDGTVRTSASNLNFNYASIVPVAVSPSQNGRSVVSGTQDSCYRWSVTASTPNGFSIPYAVVYGTSHFGDDTGIVSGARNRKTVLPLVAQALSVEDEKQYQKIQKVFQAAHSSTFSRVAGLKQANEKRRDSWDRQQQYEGHAQLVFRIRDQFGVPVEHFDVHIYSQQSRGRQKLELMMEDKHCSRLYPGTIVFYLRTRRFHRQLRQWEELLEWVAPVVLEIHGVEPESERIRYRPLSIRFSSSQIGRLINSFQTTVVDVTLLRMPDESVFEVYPQ